MLPILRLIPVGGVFLAIAILLLALNPLRTESPSAEAKLMPARGALIDRSEHPEWRQFLMLAALRRADEVEQLRDLRDTANRNAPQTQVTPERATARPVLQPAIDVNAPVAAKPAMDAPKVVETTAEVADVLPNVEEAAPFDTAPAEDNLVTVETKPAVSAPKPIVDEPKSAETAPVAAKPKAAVLAPSAMNSEREASTQTPSIAPAEVPHAKPAPAAKPADAAAPPQKEVASARTAVRASPVVDSEREAPTQTVPIASADVPHAKPAPAPKPADAAAPPQKEATSAGTAVLASPAVNPEPEAPTQTGPIAPADVPHAKPAPAAKPADAAAPSQKEAASARTAAPARETTGSRIDPASPTPAPAAPAAVKIADLSASPGPENDDITGSIGPADQTATIPVGIGEASSTEIEVILPTERPPVLKRLDLSHMHKSKIERTRHRSEHARIHHGKTKAENAPAEFNLFALLYQIFQKDASHKPAMPTIQ